MLQPYLKSGTLAICLITPEPDRGEKIIQCEDWSFFTWDCLRGIRKAGTHQTINEVTDPVEAINFLNGCKDCVLIMHNLQLFLDVPEVVQAIQNGVYRVAPTKKRLSQNDLTALNCWCRDQESNQGHTDFQSVALPTELSRHLMCSAIY